MQLVVSNNNIANPLTLDLSSYIQVGDKSMDPVDPAFSEKVISHSLLKEGGILAMTDDKDKELVFPLLLSAANSSAVAQLVIELNQILETGGATASWQDDGMSQPTVFDLIGGQFDIEYDYRKAQKAYVSGKLRFFAQPFGRTAGPRMYAAASGIGPLLMISPYASSGALAIGASTQAGQAGFGGAPAGASTGVFYYGSPSLAGDAPALMQISYLGPKPVGASQLGAAPLVAVSLLPDGRYPPLITCGDITAQEGLSLLTASTAVASTYYSTASQSGEAVLHFPPGFQAQLAPNNTPPLSWAGKHRLLAIARASAGTGALITEPNALVPYSSAASITTTDWALYDLGTFSIKASQPLADQPVVVLAKPPPLGAVDVTALAMLPDSATWFINPTGVAMASQLGLFDVGVAVSYSNAYVLDDVLSEQFLAVNPIATVPSITTAELNAQNTVTPFSRGLVPRPDPKNGLPVIAILGVAQTSTPSLTYTDLLGNSQSMAGASWANPQNAPTYALVEVMERTRYILP